MMLEALYKILLATPAVTAAVGTQIHYAQGPQDITGPTLILQDITLPISYHMQGADPHRIPTFRVNCLATEYIAASDLKQIVVDALKDFKGLVPGGSPAIDIKWIMVQNVAPIPSVTPEGKEEPELGYVVDLRALYKPLP